jgi:general secretion pathway protein D
VNAAARWIGIWVAAAALVAGCVSQHPAYLKGQELLAAGQWEDAISQMELAAKDDERHPEYRAAVIGARAQALNELARQAGPLREAGRFSEAEALYRRMLRIQPDESRAIAGLQQTAGDRRRVALLKEAEAAFAKNDLRVAEQSARTILSEAPKNVGALALMRRIEERKTRLGGLAPVPAAMRKPITLQFRDANIRMIFDAISRETGINFVLDRDIPPAARATILVKNTPVEDAVDSLIATNALSKKIVGESQVLIYPNTPAKIKEYQELVIRNFYLQAAEAKQMLTLLRTILKSQNIFIDERRNLLVIRDTPEAVRLAERLIAAHDQVEPEVMLEVEILEVSRGRETELGVRFPDRVTFGVVDPITLQALRNLNSSQVNVSGLETALQLNLKALFERVNLLANPRIRVRNREKAKFHVGDRLPVIASSISTTTTLQSQQVTYLETGIKLEVEPQVLDDDVMIKVGLEVSTPGPPLTTVAGAIAYEVRTRNANTVLTLKDGETQVLAGLLRDAETDAINKVPGLGEIPVVGWLFSNRANEQVKTEVVLSITPRILRRLVRPSAELAEFWSGPETNVRSAVTPSLPIAPGAKPLPGKPVAPGGVFPGGVIQKPPATTPSPVGAAPTAPAPTAPAAPAPAPAPQPTPAAPPTLPPGFIFQPPPGVGQ